MINAVVDRPLKHLSEIPLCMHAAAVLEFDEALGISPGQCMSRAPERDQRSKPSANDWVEGGRVEGMIDWEIQLLYCAEGHPRR